MKAIEQCFPVVLYIMLYKVVLTFESVNEILQCDIQIKATEQYFPVGLANEIQQCDIQLKPTDQYFPVEFVNEILKCDIQLKATEHYFTVVRFVILWF